MPVPIVYKQYLTVPLKVLRAKFLVLQTDYKNSARTVYVVSYHIINPMMFIFIVHNSDRVSTNGRGTLMFYFVLS